MRIVGIIVKDGEILLMHRARDGQEYYVFPGGSIENKETEEDALKREMKEETGLLVEDSRKLFEIENQGQREIYCLIKEFSGIIEIKGPEKERMNEQNQYQLEWRGLSAIKGLNNLYPKEAVKKLLEFLQAQEGVAETKI